MRYPAQSILPRFIAASVVLIIVTTLAAGVPAYWLIRTKLEQDTWTRVETGGQTTLTLYESESERLYSLATLIAQRPTLERLLRDGEEQALSGYLQDFLTGVDLGMLIVHDSSGQLLGAAPNDDPGAEYPAIHDVTFYVVPGSAPQLVLLAAQPIYDPQSGDQLGTVTAGMFLDDDFARRIAADTGFEQSIILEGNRIATSLASDTSSNSTDTDIEQVLAGETKKAAITHGQTHYYAVLLTLVDAQDSVVAMAEVALSVEGLISVERQALSLLILSTLLVAGAGSIVGALLARRLTAPIRQLTWAAFNMGQGDLVTPIAVPESPGEIMTLASAFEESRAKTRQALVALEQAKTWSDTLIQSIVEGIITFDTEGNITFFSQGAARILGRPRAEVIGRPLDQIVRLSEVDGYFSESVPPGGKRQIRILTHDDREVALSVTRVPLIPPGSDDEQVALVLRDITEEQAAQNLRAYFLANVSHEFRTPLAALNASVEMLLDELGNLSPDEMRELLNALHRSVTGLQTLIDNLLESSSIEAGRFRIRSRLTDFYEVVDDAIRVMGPLLDRREQRVSLSKPAKLRLVNVDPTRLNQVLVNLLSNASKYSPIGGTIAVNLSLPSANQLHVAIADRGMGIAPADRADLFQRFVRLGSQDKTQYGVGLGLWVAKVIVEEHGGEIGVDEREGGGSIFWFDLPLKRDAQ